MSLYDREYMQTAPRWRTDRLRETAGRRGGAAPGAAMAVLAANVVVFLLEASGGRVARAVTGFGIMQPEAVIHGQLWRLFTATYLHASLGHLFANMLGLYFFGGPLEAVWGTKRFLAVYTLGGVAGNVVLTAAGLLGFMDPFTLGLGASGSILTLVGAAAVLFPEARVYVYFLFPLRLRTFAVLYGVWFVFNIANQGQNYGGDICHLIGILIGAGYAWVSRPRSQHWIQ
jgi:membrane associated rhomboid family serine protease